MQAGNTQNHIKLKREREIGILTSLIKVQRTHGRPWHLTKLLKQSMHSKGKERDKQRVHKALIHTYMPRGGLGLSRPNLPTNENNKYQSRKKIKRMHKHQFRVTCQRRAKAQKA